MKLSDVRDRLFQAIQRTIDGPLQISGSESLTTELGMNSLQMMNLFAFIDSDIGAVDLTPWLLESSCGGRDTIEGLCLYLAAALGASDQREVQ